MRQPKKMASVALSLALAGALCVPALSFAESESSSESFQENLEVSDLSAVKLAQSETESGETGNAVTSGRSSLAVTADTTGTCTATIRHYENITYEDPEGNPNER